MNGFVPDADLDFFLNSRFRFSSSKPASRYCPSKYGQRVEKNQAHRCGEKKLLLMPKAVTAKTHPLGARRLAHLIFKLFKKILATRNTKADDAGTNIEGNYHFNVVAGQFQAVCPAAIRDFFQSLIIISPPHRRQPPPCRICR